MITNGSPVNVDVVKVGMLGKWPRVLPMICPETLDAFSHAPRKVTCPFHDHEDLDPSFRFVDAEKGTWVCTCSNSKTQSPWDLIMRLRGIQFMEAIRLVANEAGLETPAVDKPQDILADVAVDKGIAIESIRAYGGQPARRGKYNVVRFPVYGGDGKKRSHFDLAPKVKGWFKKGRGQYGLFLPHDEKGNPTLPNNEHPVCLVEGVKDAAKLHELGYYAVGLNTSTLYQEFDQLFRGLDVVFVPDRDCAGAQGAVAAAARLVGTAVTARIATLPAPFRPTKGPDVRDVTRKTNGSQAVRDAIAGAVPWDQFIIPDQRPEVPLPGGEFSITGAGRSLGALMRNSGKFYRRGGSIVRAEDDDGATILKDCKPAELASAFETIAVLVRKRGDDVEPAICSEGAAKLIISSEAFTSSLHVIKAISPCPLLAGKPGELRVVRGYDEESRILTSGAMPADVPLDEAVGMLLGALSDFNFATPSDKSRAAAALISPGLVMSGLLGGRCPIDLGEADDSQTGKGYRNRLVGAIYNAKIIPVTQRSGGGVGSMEEAFNSAVVEGRTLIPIDNVRGRIDSPAIESFLTEDRYLARIPYSAPIEIDARRVILMITSNSAQATKDLMNRASIVRILKHDDGHEFQSFPEGDLLEHVKANQPRYLGAVFAVIRAWDEAGRPKTRETRHDFRPWARTMDWIVQTIFGLPPLLDGHREAQGRASNPHSTWLRDVVLAVVKSGHTKQWLRVHKLIDIMDEHAVDIPGVKRDDSIDDDTIWKQANQQVGRRLSKCFKVVNKTEGNDQLIVDGWTLERREEHDDAGRRVMEYFVSPLIPADTRTVTSDAVEQACFPTGGALDHSVPKGGVPADAPADTSLIVPADKTRESADLSDSPEHLEDIFLSTDICSRKTENKKFYGASADQGESAGDDEAEAWE